MKISILALSMAASASRAPAADDASLTGKWQIQRSAGGNESRQDRAFTHKGGELTGTCETAHRPTVHFKGKVEGKNVTWTYQTESPGGTVTVIRKGVIESPDKISGTLPAVEFSV
jgi:hypothetical protein